MSNIDDVNQLVEVVRKQLLIRVDVRRLLETPIDQRNDAFYARVAAMSVDYDALEADRVKLVKRIPSGEAFFA